MVYQADAMRLHLQEQISLYGAQSLVSLVNQKGYEQPVKEAYEKYVAKVGTICSFTHLNLITLPGQSIES
jgi:hypothetical protein